MMTKDSALLIAGIVFALIALIHLLRIIFAPTIMIGNVFVPVWANVIGFLVAFVLSMLMFMARRKTF